MAPPPHPRGTMIQFTYKLKLDERVHPRYNPEKDDMVDGLREHYFRTARHSAATRQKQGRLADHFRYADLSLPISWGERFL
jgi:hypothetical protein